MSERIYAWLLRLYPARFRAEYEDAALQLFRDRSEHERGLWRGLRLWFDLVADLAASLPRQHLSARRPLAVSTGAGAADVPSFHVLEGESLRMGRLVAGSLLSLIAFGGCSILINYLGRYRSPVRVSESGWFGLGFGGPANGQSAGSQGAMAARSDRGGKFDAVERQRVIEGAAENLKEHYHDPAVAEKMAETLAAHEKGGDYNQLSDGAAFADRVTKDLREVSRDPHVVIEYSAAPLPVPRTGMSGEDLSRYRKAMQRENCTFRKVEILPRSVGYFKLDSFPDASVCEAAARDAMARLNGADALIFDLRDNRGGFPNMVSLIAAYLFDHPEYLYNPRENTTEASWTRSPVAGSRLADKPVYILTSRTTASGAEQFSYDLKMLRRATLVGETTRGAAHAGVWHWIDDHFGVGIPEARAINPFSKADWEGTGVEPDVRVRAAEALETALGLASRRLAVR